MGTNFMRGSHEGEDIRGIVHQRTLTKELIK